MTVPRQPPPDTDTRRRDAETQSFFLPNSSLCLRASVARDGELERRAEPELQLPGFVRHVVLRNRRAVIGRANRRYVVAVVHVVEQVEHLDDAVKGGVV